MRSLSIVALVAPVALGAGLLVGCTDARPPSTPEGESLVGCLDGQDHLRIDRSGGTLCVGGHTLHVPPGAFSRPTLVRIAPVDDTEPADGVDGLNILAQVEIDFEATPSRPLLWLGPFTVRAGTRPRAGALLTPLHFANGVWQRATDAPVTGVGRGMPGLVDKTGDRGAALVFVSGRHALAEPSTGRYDTVRLEDGGTCHPLDAHHARDSDVGRAETSTLYDARLVTRPLAELLQSRQQGPGELAGSLASTLSLEALAEALRDSLDDQLCVGHSPAGNGSTVERLAFEAVRRIEGLPADCEVEREAALVIAGWALWLQAHEALFETHAATLDAHGVRRSVVDASQAAFAEVGDACSGGGPVTVDALVSGSGPVPSTLADALARMSGAAPTDLATDLATDLTLLDVRQPMERCQWHGLIDPGTPSFTGDDTPVSSEEALSLLAERAWLDSLVDELGRQGAFQGGGPGALESLDRAREGRALWLTGLLRMMARHDTPVGSGELAGWARRDFIDGRTLAFLVAGPDCITPPVAQPGQPDPCVPRLEAPADGALVLDPVLQWSLTDERCYGADIPDFLLACQRSSHELLAESGVAIQPRPVGPQPAPTRWLVDMQDTGCTDPGQWWWRVAYVDRVTGLPRWSEPRRYTVHEPPADPCATAVGECSEVRGEPVDCRPARRDALPCDRCIAGRCAPHDEVDGDAVNSPLAQGGGGGAGGLQVPLACDQGDAVHAPIDGDVTIDGERVCISGAALTVCLDGVVPDPDLSAACRATVGDGLGACGPRGLVVDALGADDRRRPLPPPALWRVVPLLNLGGPPCCRTDEICDGIDNDCDGALDELQHVEGRPCEQPCISGDARAGQLQCGAGRDECRPDIPCGPANERCSRPAAWGAVMDGQQGGNLPVLRGDTAWASDEHVGCGAQPGGDVFYRLEVGTRAALWLSVEGAQGATVSLYRNAASCRDPEGGFLACGIRVDGVEVDAGTYRVVVDGVGGGGEFVLRGHWSPRCVPGDEVPAPPGALPCDRPWVCDSRGLAPECVEDEEAGMDIVDLVDPLVDPCDAGIPCDAGMVVNPGPVPAPPVCQPHEELVDDQCQPRPLCRVHGTADTHLYPQRLNEEGNGINAIVMEIFAGELSEDELRFVDPLGEQCDPARNPEVDPALDGVLCPEVENANVVNGSLPDPGTWPCDTFPITLRKGPNEDRRVFDPSEQNDVACLGAANDCDQIQIREIHHRIKAAGDGDDDGDVLQVQRGAGGEANQSHGFTIEQVGVCSLTARLDLANLLGDGCEDRVYLHVVRDACPEEPEGRNYWQSNVLEVGRDCED